ncbi:MAG: SIS domain-containing protein, partial [Candidatus Saccharimonadales bacterium]
MLDDLKLIHERDAQDALGVAEKQARQLTYDFEITPAVSLATVKNVVFGGMGGSALGALIAQSWPGFDLPFEVSRNYDIPSYVGAETVFFASSYSGNTEETLSALDQAAAKGAQMVVITSGGKLADIARDKQYPLLLLPSGLQPRHAVLYSLKALLTVTDTLKLTKNAAQELATKADFLQQAVQAWLPTVPTKDNYAKQLALEMIGKSVVVYA